jgi:predicted ATPase
VSTPHRAPRQPGQHAPARLHNLPAPHTHLIGREQDSTTVGNLVLQAPGRLVTLTGTGGCGKTQLALHVARGLLAAFHDGVWLMELAPVQAAHMLPYAVASVLGRRERPGEAMIDTIVAYLKGRELLLVLDNCEHQIDVCADLAERVLTGCPRVRLLATSRERLRITAETNWRVPSLASPDRRGGGTPRDLLEYPAVRLFVECAQAVQSRFKLGPGNASVVVDICGRVEGLPLALELAAANVEALALSQILERLDDSFRLLVGGSRTAPTRQQTLRATLPCRPRESP